MRDARGVVNWAVRDPDLGGAEAACRLGLEEARAPCAQWLGLIENEKPKGVGRRREPPSGACGQWLRGNWGPNGEHCTVRFWSGGPVQCS
jgi:hypothetical protein